jgi:hypothetical protein
MPALSKPKYEMVAQALAEGKSQADAYRAGGFIYKSANASRLCRSPAIAARVGEILGQRAAKEAKAREIGIERAGLTEEWIIVRLKHVIDLSIRGLPVYDRNGNSVGLFKPNLDAANSGLRTAAQIVGLLVQKHEVAGSGAFSRMTDEALDQALLQECRSIGLSKSSTDEIMKLMAAC